MPDYARLNEERWELFPRAACTGLAVGLVAVAFRLCLECAELGRDAVLERARAAGGVGLLAVVPPAVGLVVAAVWVVRRFAPEASGSGIPHLKKLLARHDPFRDRRVIWVKFLSGVLGLAAGLGLGREGPTIQIGAAVSRWVGRRWRHSHTDTQDSLLICGAAAGLAAAFNAPLAGVIFALEELQIRFSNTVFFATVVACLASDTVTRSLLGGLPEFKVLDRPPELSALPHCVLIGALAAVVGATFNHALLAATVASRRLGGRWWLLNAAAGAALVAAVGWVEPSAIGGGRRLVERLLGDGVPLGPAVVLLVVRFSLTVGSYGLGSAGGLFAPMLVVGGLLGSAVGQVERSAGIPGTPDPAVCAVAGMAAIMGAMVRCPLTGIVLLVEMTGYYPLILPLMVASFVGAGVADARGVVPIYEALMDLGEKGEGKATDASYPR